MDVDKYQEHSKKRRACFFLDHSFGGDWVTCNHSGNPTALQVCSHEHCPLPLPTEGRCDNCNHKETGCEPCCKW